MVALTSAAQAAWVDRGGGMIYDTTLDITSLADMNYALTSGHAGAGVSADGTMTWDAAPFKNMQSNVYWSGTEYAPHPDLAWFFYTKLGSQNSGNKVNALHAVAVRPGDVAAPVPEPQTLALALLALSATVMAQRRRPR